ncbi:MAG: LPS export ABC transporter periplasmic protein LptC [Vicinamibacterales bacterium]
MRWHTLARVAAALAGAVVVAVVVTNVRSRPARVTQPAPPRLDPKASVETTGSTTTEIRGVKEDYQVRAAHQFLYRDGTSLSRDVTITVKNRSGRDFVMSGREARAGEKNSSLDLTGDVHLTASDGFEIDTAEAHYAEADGLVRAPGAFTFHRGRMEGSGVGMEYDKAADVLTITASAHVIFRDDAGAVTTDVSGGSATLDRVAHTLTIDGQAHALRGEQQLDADRLLARLTESNEEVTFLELRGSARVAGGSEAFDAMSADSIDLAYTEDGSVLERVTLDGTAAVALAGTAKGTTGRQFFGDHLAFTLAGGTSVTGLSGQGRVRLELPAAGDSPRRTVAARQVAASGEPGQGLRSAAFSGGVTFTEHGAGRDARPRTARSTSLALELQEDAVDRARFAGGVTFEEQDLAASAGTADYDPGAGLLRLDGRGPQGAPRVEDPRVRVAGDRIDLTLGSHGMTATGHVETELRADADGDRAGVLDRSQAARVNADRFTYGGGEDGPAVYDGGVQLWQGETTIRSQRLELDRASGDLDATGAARATLVLETGSLIGRAERIHYADANRTLEYLDSAAPAPGAPRTGTAGASGSTPVQLSGPQGDLRASRIVITLAGEARAMERMDATGRVTMKVDTRTIAGTRLRYSVADERYDVEGTPSAPVTVTQACDSTTGRTLTWFRATDRMLIDGRDDARTQTTSRGGPCPPAATPPTTVPPRTP